MGFFKKAMVVATVASAFSGLAGQGGAFAEGPDVLSDVAIVVGTGTLAPGLPGDPRVCWVQTSVTFDALVDVEAGDEGAHAQQVIHFAGSSGAFCESALSGAGSGNLSGAYTGTVNYTRTGNIVVLSGIVTAGGDTDFILAAVCNFVPTTINWVTSYALTCAVSVQ